MPVVEELGNRAVFNTINATTQSASAKQGLRQEPVAAPAPVEGAQAALPVTANEPSASVPKLEDDPRFQAVARKEREVFRLRKSLEQKEKDLESKYKPWEEAEQIKKQSKIEFLKRHGISYDDVTNEFLGHQNLTPEQIAEIKAEEIVNQKLEHFTKQQKEDQERHQTEQYEKAKKQLHADAKAIVASSENYLLVKDADAFDTVVEFIESVFKEGDESLPGYEEPGRVIPTEKAVEILEKRMEDDIFEFVSKSEKLKRRLGILETQSSSPKSLDSPKSQTITNKTTTTPSNPMPVLTAKERRERAIRIAQTGRPD